MYKVLILIALSYTIYDFIVNFSKPVFGKQVVMLAETAVGGTQMSKKILKG